MVAEGMNFDMIAAWLPWVLVTIGLTNLVAITLVIFAISRWQARVRRVEMMRNGDWDMLTEHQDLLANHESRLLRLGTPGPGPVLTMQQILDAHAKTMTSR